jgi:hypothetical protein
MSAPELSGPHRHVTRRDHGHSPHAHIVKANATPAPGLIGPASSLLMSDICRHWPLVGSVTKLDDISSTFFLSITST